MMTLKAAVIAASAIGTVAVGGGATWAMTGTHQEAGLQSHGAKAPAAERKVQDAVPKADPTCLPARPDLPKAKVPETGAKKQLEKQKQQVEKQLEQNRATRDLPGADVPPKDLPKPGLPGTGLPDTGLPDTGLPDTGVPGVKAPDARSKLPADLPTCAPSTEDLPKGRPVDRPDARVPAKPGLPAVPKLDCSKLAPAVKVGGPVEKTVMLAKGLRHVSTVPGSADLRKKNICAVTQKWVAKAGTVGGNARWITVETLKTPAGMTQNQLRQAMRLPEGGNGVLLFDPNGTSMLVNGSPALTGGALKDVATALRQGR
ncbi:hypothetical protein [Actinomadura sp. 7K507]|uniref:hypothetical protein n=1 Tax=Actinomadura sp. 7K507 TaxID=2530365 RepID=UPI0010488581|nr:hypothetical protein [Actinomadura sp. 7K507]TDC96047.1 hypothetical protein E1285_06415 [Actinomadura sp. 7K507]